MEGSTLVPCHNEPFVASRMSCKQGRTRVYQTREENMRPNVATAILEACLREILIEKAATKCPQDNRK